MSSGLRRPAGIGCIKNRDAERMLILTDIEALMSSAEMGLMEAELF
jgi:purine-binding chemotaxis protein CheW